MYFNEIGRGCDVSYSEWETEPCRKLTAGLEEAKLVWIGSEVDACDEAICAPSSTRVVHICHQNQL